MAHHLLERLAIPIPLRLGLLDDAAHLDHLGLGQLHVARRPVLFQSVGLGRARDGDEALGGDPGEGDLRGGTALFGGQLLHLADDSAVLVEVLALELGD